MTAMHTETIVYARRGAAELALDVFRPETESNDCAVLLFHGGGWRVGAKEMVHAQAGALAARGFTAVAAQYRLLDAAAWPAQLDDAVAACAWVRDNAGALGVDPAKLVVQGHSAGAQMGLMTGTLAAGVRPAAIVAYYPPIGFHPTAPSADPTGPPFPVELDELGRVPGWMLFPPGTPPADLDAASPITLLHKDFPPTIIFQGTADKLLGIRSSVTLHQRLVELGVPADLHIYADRDHAFDMAPSMTEATVRATTSFLERFVTRREESEAEARRFAFAPAERR
jgi:acetyl esterase/lipase